LGRDENNARLNFAMAMPFLAVDFESTARANWDEMQKVKG
jgi:hypothetical protein